MARPHPHDRCAFRRSAEEVGDDHRDVRTLADVTEIPLGHAQASSVALNYHDCIGRQKFWFQDGIRNLRGKIDPPKSKRGRAFWPVNVVAGGEYTIELRRWPRELDAAIHA